MSCARLTANTDTVGWVARTLIIGASRGIGLGLVDIHLEDAWTVHATTRDGSAPRGHRDLTTHRLEVRDPGQLETMLSAIDEPFDRIIHNAGVMRAPRSELMAVNAEAPIRVAEALLRAGLLFQGGALAIMTSQAGARRGGGASLGAYGESKAALNDNFRERNPEWRDSGAIAVVIHPGWVKTDMGGSAASLTVRESVEGIKHVLDDLSPADHGKFLTWDGRVHAW